MSQTLAAATAVAVAAAAYAYTIGDETVLFAAGAVGIALLAATLLSMGGGGGGKKAEKQEILLVDSKAKHSLKLIEREVSVQAGRALRCGVPRASTVVIPCDFGLYWFTEKQHAQTRETNHQTSAQNNAMGTSWSRANRCALPPAHPCRSPRLAGDFTRRSALPI